MLLKAQLESILFVSGKALSAKELGKIVKNKVKKVEEELQSLMKEYQEEGRGINLVKNNGKYQMTTSPDNAQLVQNFLQDETKGELSQPSLETLSIIAYRGPIAKLELNKIRGVNCSLIIRNLLLRGLIEEKFNPSQEEYYYTVTHDFVRFLGLNEITDLEDYEKLNKLETVSKVIEDKLEE